MFVHHICEFSHKTSNFSCYQAKFIKGHQPNLMDNPSYEWVNTIIMENKNVKYTKSAGGVVVNRDGLILVVNQDGTTWSLPKGHINEGESELEAAKREIYEESGIKDLMLIKELGCYQRYKLNKSGGEDISELKTITMFLFKTAEDILNPIDLGNPEARWIEKSKVADLLSHPKDKEFFIRILNENII